MNYAYLDTRSKRALRRAMLNALSLPGRKIPLSVPEMPIAYSWGVGGMAVTAALLTPEAAKSRRPWLGRYGECFEYQILLPQERRCRDDRDSL